MKKHITNIIVGLFIFLGFLSGCKPAAKIQYVPVESVKTVYQDRVSRDSIYLYDSVFIRDKGDTLLIERYYREYIDRWKVDSIFVHDSIQVPYEVQVPGEHVNYVTGWQNFQIWCGRILLAALLVFGIVTVIRKKFFS
jgi:hypothetical protein